MPAVNLRFEDLRARDNQKIDRDFFNKRYRLIAEAIMAVAKEVDGVAEDSDNLVSLGLVRVNEVLGPLLAKVQAASEEGFLVAESATSVQLSVGLQTTFEITAGWQRDLFQPTPYVMLSRQGGSVDDWALFKVDTYDRDNGGMAGEIVAVNGVIDAAAHTDWVVSATAGIAKAVMEQAAAAQVAIDDAQAAAAAAEQAAADAEAVLAEGPVSSVNGQTGAVALGVGDIPTLTTQLGQKAASNHGHEIEEVTGLQDALNAAATAEHSHEIADVTGLQDALDAAGGGNVVFKSAAYTASAGDVVVTDTTGGAFTVTLPATPTAGDKVSFVDGADWGANSLTIARNGATIEGAAEDLTCNLGGVSFQLIYDGATWLLPKSVETGGGQAATLAGAETLTNKTISSASNSLMIETDEAIFTVGGHAPGFRNIPVNGQAGIYTLTADDVGRVVTAVDGQTVPDGVFAAGDVVSIYNATAADLTITCAITTAYIAGIDGDQASVTLSARGVASVLFIGPNECVITGNVA